MTNGNTREDVINAGKIPPQDLESEKAILAALIIEPKSFNTIAGTLKPDHFYKEDHVLIFKAISNLFEIGSNIDIITVMSQLQKMGKLEEAGGAFFISQITSHVASAAHIETHVRIVVDNYIRRKAILLSSTLTSKAYDPTVSLDEILGSAVDMDTQLSDDTHFDSDIAPMTNVIDEAIELMETRCDMFKNNKPIGIPTPLSSLNHKIVGFMAQQFIIIGARPGHGKTAFALACAKHQSKLGFKPAFFTLEMSNVSLVNRLITAEAGVDAMRYRKGDISYGEKQDIIQAANTLRKHNIYISDRASNGVAQIKASVKKLITDGKCDIVYVDYLQLVSPGEQQSREQQISVISRSLKLMAKELDIPVVAMSQLSRSMEMGDKRPKLSHLRESGSLEQDSDCVLFLFRPSEYNLLDDDGNDYSPEDSEIIIAKQREGPLDKLRVRTNESKSVYYDIEKSESEPVPVKNFYETTTEDIFKDFEQDLSNMQTNPSHFD